MPSKPSKLEIYSNSGHKLTPNENKFIDEYVKTGNGTQSVIEAGYKTKSPVQYAHTLLTKDYIAEEIKFRLNKIQSSTIADAQEIMEYFSAVMRGEVTDQFGLEAPLSERTKAAQELAKRQIDMVNKANQATAPEIKITLDWARTNKTPTVSEVVNTDTAPIIDKLLDKKGTIDNE